MSIHLWGISIFQGLMLRRQDNFKMPVLFTPRPRKHLIRQKSLHSDSAVMVRH